MADLKPGMALEGTVTNVTNFGAFVDIGVRQDGLVHLSQMSNRFIRDPREAVKVGDVVQVKVISIEPETKRIGLSMKALLPAVQRRRKKQQRRAQKPSAPARNPERATTGSGAGADAASPSEAADKTALPGARPKPNRQHEGPPRHRRRVARKPEGTEEPERQKEPSPKEPEPSLQEKIAILQSKFRGIN
jgi:predicted RNA-binding protein with RPS1 domain